MPAIPIIIIGNHTRLHMSMNFSILQGLATYSWENNPEIEMSKTLYVHHITINAKRKVGTDNPMNPTKVQK